MQGEYILEGMLNALIQMEDAGDALYKRMSEETEDPDLSRVFSILANQEAHHKHMYESYKGILTAKDQVDSVKLEYLDSLIAKTVSFLNDENIPDNLDAAIQRATQFEEDTIQFLSEMKILIYPKFHSEIDILIEEERKHLDYLMRLRKEKS